jgi:23S rRNA (uracil1939-C5)-methyltransferase
VNLATGGPAAGEAVHVVRRDVARWRPRRADVVVADPPRAGLGAAVARLVGGTGADRLALVSCDAASLARDARALVDLGWRVRSCTLVDMFPQTPHVEVVTAFER